MIEYCKYKNNTNNSKMNTGGVIMNNVIITLRTNEEIKKELDRLALEENRSLNNYIMTILIKHIEEQNKKD